MYRESEVGITSLEIKYILSYFKKGKSLGPYGLSMEFDLGFYDRLEHDLVQVIEESRTSGKVLGVLGSTFIALVHKK